MRKSEFKKIKSFHGHIGPYVITGFLLGKTARRHIKIKKITVYNPLKTPYSCLIDGLQLSSGCTVGRGSIKLKKNFRLRVIIKGKNKQAKIEFSPRFKEWARENFEGDIKKFAKDIERLIRNKF